MWPSSSKDKPEQENGIVYGMTSPISVASPKPIDNVRTKELEEVLSSFDVMETEEELNHRMEVLSRLNEMVKDWIIETSLLQNMPQEAAELVGGKICTFGSYRLGVHSRGADIDALCIAPRHIKRQDYFTSFYERLKNCPDVKELRKVEEAFVPLIRMNFDGIEIDLLFARLLLSQIPDSVDLKDDTILKNLDPKCVRSLNGCRVTDEILRLVPNVETFRMALRVIKLWAKRHGIYSNILGYLGGVSWAMLVARTCQLYPNAVPATIVQKFFLVFSQWKWPQPVLLKQPSTTNYNFSVWNPHTNLGDRAHVMPIITPAYPQQNSTFNVSNATLTILTKEFQDGFKLAEEVMLGRSSWHLLFEKPMFFAKYKHFILLMALSKTKEEHLEWYGLLEAKIRHLVAILERNKLIEIVHVNPEIFKLKPDYFKTDDASGSENQICEEIPNSLWFIGLKFGQIGNVSINLTGEIQKFTDEVMKHATLINMYRTTMKIEAKYVKRKNLNQYISSDIIEKDKKAFAGLSSMITNGATELLRRNGITPLPPVSSYKKNNVINNVVNNGSNNATNMILENSPPKVENPLKRNAVEIAHSSIVPEKIKNNGMVNRASPPNPTISTPSPPKQDDEIIDLDESDEVEAVISSEEDTENDNSSGQFKEDTDDSLSIPLIDLTDDGPEADISFVSSTIKLNGPKMIKF